ncbi:MAG: tRNA (5-methylaminomethyl-2-thiouridine)(34)-methyltransferase MnmD [Alphaproteobacteria bacterium]|nr:tRNA (5-methylaminomethyl-2-thiouridine)(34)-methyltransferase MnmD [Alphaproteobacteria bacterium]
MRPYSPRFAEHYWSPAGGVTEKQVVFLAGNQLPARWGTLAPESTFTVAELGFGTGLNFALTAAEFIATAPVTTKLVYLGYEAYPLPLGELLAIHQTLPVALHPWLQQLADAWPQPQPGWQTVAWGRVILQLWIGTAASGVTHQPQPADAWYLDGFSPAKNPDLWSLPLLQQVAAHSNPGATVATYSVARMVRDNLTAAGFTVQKRAGVPPKRDRLEGQLRA